jgi:hypothetical protein
MQSSAVLPVANSVLLLLAELLAWLLDCDASVPPGVLETAPAAVALPDVLFFALSLTWFQLGIAGPVVTSSLLAPWLFDGAAALGAAISRHVDNDSSSIVISIEQPRREWLFRQVIANFVN